MASNKKQFLGMYDQAVDLLKKFKQSNDALNKSIGIQHESSITLKIRSEQSSFNGMIKKLDRLLERLQQSYLDPDTARKIGTVKQQYKIQKDRREHLLKSLSQQSDNKMPHETSQKERYVRYRSNSGDHRRQTNIQQFPQQKQRSTQHSITREQVTEYDYEIECQLLREKNISLQQAQKKLLNVYNITKECKEMVDFQGENLDIISDEIFKVKGNTTAALQEIKQANEHSRSRKRKIYTFSLIMLILTLCLLVFVLF